MSKKSFTVRLDQDALEAFGKVASANHMEPTAYAALWISRLSDLKQEHGLDAVTAIPKEYFKLKPGRTAGRQTEAAAGAT